MSRYESRIKSLKHTNRQGLLEGSPDRSVNWHQLSSFPRRRNQSKDRLVDRRSPYGWVVFRSNSYVALPEAKPVDITEFCKTESMGVSVSPCTYETAKMSSEERTELKLIDYSCELEGNKWMMKYPWKRDPSSLPDNYAQVLKKLESTEQRLMKKPEHTLSYDMQVKEIKEMKFSSKLTVKEKSE